MIVVWLFPTMPWVCLQFVIVLFPDHTHLLFLIFSVDFIFQMLQIANLKIIGIDSTDTLFSKLRPAGLNHHLQKCVSH